MKKEKQRYSDILLKRELESTPADKNINLAAIIMSISAFALVSIFFAVSGIFVIINGETGKVLPIIWFFLFFIEIPTIFVALFLGTRQLLRQKYFSALMSVIFAGTALIIIAIFIVLCVVYFDFLAIPFAFNPF